MASVLASMMRRTKGCSSCGREPKMANAHTRAQAALCLSPTTTSWSRPSRRCAREATSRLLQRSGAGLVTLHENGRKTKEDLAVSPTTVEIKGESEELKAMKNIVQDMIDKVEKARKRRDPECKPLYNREWDAPIYAFERGDRFDAFRLGSSLTLPIKHPKLKALLKKKGARAAGDVLKVYVSKPAGT